MKLSQEARRQLMEDLKDLECASTPKDMREVLQRMITLSLPKPM
jgi:hypothetical protein